MDLYSFLNEIAITLFKHGWSVTTWGILGALFFRLNGVRKMVLRRVPKRFRHEDKLDRIERKIDALSAQIGGAEWIASSSEATTPYSAGKNATPFISRLVALITAGSAKRSMNSNSRRKKSMWKKLKSRKFLLALATGILIVLNDGLDMGLNTETIMYVVGIVATWILGESAVDTVRAKKEASNDRTFTTPTEPTE